MLSKVTIVTPSFNQAAYLEQTIMSVLNQDYPNIEYIVIDGGSTDGSVDVIKRYQDRLAYWISEPDGGQSHAINKAFEHATGQIFNWLNSDDLLMPSAVRIAVHYLTENPDIGMVYGDRIIIDEGGNFLSLTQVPSYNAGIFRHHLRVPQETTFFRSELWMQVDGVDEELKFCMDYDLFVKLSKITQFYHIPFVLGAYRKHPLSKTVIYSRTLKTVGKEEFNRVYRRHYLKDRSRLKVKFCKKLNNLRLYFETRSKSYKCEISKILKIIRDNNGIAE
jgi:glycosyltransferase involved in cell wall biosynthesis